VHHSRIVIDGTGLSCYEVARSTPSGDMTIVTSPRAARATS